MKNIDPTIVKVFRDLPEEQQIKIIRGFPEFLRMLKNPSESLQLAAIMSDSYNPPLVLKYIKNPSEKVQLQAIKADTFSYRYIENPTAAAKALQARLWGSLGDKRIVR